MALNLNNFILQKTAAASIEAKTTIQELWSGYGEIIRYKLKGGAVPSVIVKQIQFPSGQNHPRGWNSSISHQRKVKSYEVEATWYQSFSEKCDDNTRVPLCLGITKLDDALVLILEDLDTVGFPIRKQQINVQEVKVCIHWLANFHATFMKVKPVGLWEIGTYWHLATRPDELKVLSDQQLKSAAVAIDRTLNNCTYQTLVHGDAKLANFCFSNDGLAVAAVDFQYVGGGCGMKDVAYFLGSCLNDSDCASLETELLNYYFQILKSAITKKAIDIDVVALEAEWRALFPVAWTDFHRFLKGWSPGHWKLTSYSERLAKQVISKLNH